MFSGSLDNESISSLSDSYIASCLPANDGLLPDSVRGDSTGMFSVGDRIVAVTTVPFMLVPDIGIENAVWFSMQTVFGTASVSMLQMKQLGVFLSLPDNCDDNSAAEILKSIAAAATEYGVGIASTKVVRSAKSEFPMIGSITVFSEGKKGGYLTPASIQEDDAIIVTKYPGIAASAMLLAMFPNTISKQYGEGFVRDSLNIFDEVSIRTELSVVSSLMRRGSDIHGVWNVADRGLLGSIFDLAENAGKGFCIDYSKLPMDERCNNICSIFGLDPHFTLGNGSMIIACSKEKTSDIIRALNNNRVVATCIGDFRKRSFGRVGIKLGIEIPIIVPKTIDFWTAFFDAYDRGMD